VSLQQPASPLAQVDLVDRAGRRVLEHRSALTDPQALRHRAVPPAQEVRQTLLGLEAR
jgi:hypothetical protein